MADLDRRTGAPTEEQLLGRIWEWAGQAVEPIDAPRIARVAIARAPARRSIALQLFAGAVPARAARWQAFGLILLLVLLASFAVGAILVGSQHRGLPAVVDPKLPPAFGPARNGVVVISVGTGASGTLVELDPVSGRTTELGPGGFTVGPDFSNDGRRLTFARPSGDGTVSLYAMNADGTGLRALGPESDSIGGAWAPDGVRFATARGRRLSITDVDTGASVGSDLAIDMGPEIQWRPNHDQLLVERIRSEDATSDPERHLGWYLVNADGSGLRQIPAERGVWSPDGSTLAYGSADGRIHLLDIDREADRILPFGGSEHRADRPEAFSPDGTRLLIRRSLLDKNAAPPSFPDTYCCRSPWLHVVVPVTGGDRPIILGSDEHKSIGGPGGGAIVSPDGKQVLAVYTQDPVGAWLFDVATGQGERQPWWTGGDWQGMTWQRLAP